MTAFPPTATGTALRRYQDNFPRHLIGVTRQLETRIMERLDTEFGHRGLRLSFEPYISLAAGAGARLSSVADSLGVSRQAANSVVDALEQLGYLARQPDPDDGRAKRLVLTAGGALLRQDGLTVAADLQRECGLIISRKRLAASCRTLHSLLEQLPETPAASLAALRLTPANARLPALLPRLADFLNRSLMDLTTAKGHPGLKLSYGQVLTLIGPEGGRMQAMAALHKVSKQAIGAVVNELQGLGYIERRPDPDDARQVLLHFTAAGLGLITDSVAAIDEVESQLRALVGREALAQLQAALRDLYCAMQPEPGFAPTTGISALARELIASLGAERARQLGALLTQANP